jgi:hypothetical protein
MKIKITDTSNSINEGGRAEAWWYGHNVKSKSSSSARAADDVDLHGILKKYKIKGFEFGNWLNNDERYDRVLACEDSLAELADILGTKNIGMDGLVGIAFGARGVTDAAAHFEPGFNMINITKKWGDGCLAHELGHALDYNIGRYYDQHKSYNYLSGGRSVSVNLHDNVGGDVRNAMNSLIDTACSMLKDRSKNYSAWGEYWRRRTEVFARLFEQYCCYKLKQKGHYDKFLTSSWSFYMKECVYWKEDEFKKLLPIMDKLVKRLKTVLNSK